MVQPSLKREGFSDIPNVKWEDVGGLDSIWQEFFRYIVRCIQFLEDFEVTSSFNPFPNPKQHLLILENIHLYVK